MKSPELIFVNNDPPNAPIIIPMLKTAWKEVMIGFPICFSTITAWEFIATSSIPAETPSRKNRITNGRRVVVGSHGINGIRMQ